MGTGQSGALCPAWSPGAATNVAGAGGNLPPAALGTGVKGAQG